MSGWTPYRLSCPRAHPMTAPGRPREDAKTRLAAISSGYIAGQNLNNGLVGARRRCVSRRGQWMVFCQTRTDTRTLPAFVFRPPCATQTWSEACARALSGPDRRNRRGEGLGAGGRPACRSRGMDHRGPVLRRSPRLTAGVLVSLVEAGLIASSRALRRVVYFETFNTSVNCFVCSGSTSGNKPGSIFGGHRWKLWCHC